MEKLIEKFNHKQIEDFMNSEILELVDIIFEADQTRKNWDFEDVNQYLHEYLKVTDKHGVFYANLTGKAQELCAYFT